MLVVPAMAATTIAKTYFSNTTGSNCNNQTAANAVTGIMGRSSDDTSTYATRVRPQSEIDSNNSGNHKIQYITSTGAADAGYGDLLVFSVSFIAQKNVKNVMLTGNGGVNISTIFDLSSEKVQKGWNKLVYVYDHSTAGDEIGEDAGSWAMYLNGECINAMGENSKNMNAENPFNYIAKGKMTQMRVMFNCIAATQEMGMYFDDAQCYTVTTDDKASVLASFEQTAPELTVADGGEYTIEDSAVTVASGTKASALKATEGAEVAVFVNDEYAFELSEDDVLEDGNEIVVTKDGIYTYYTVGSPDTDNNIIYSTKFIGGAYDSGFTLANSGFFKAEYVTGKAGKQSADTSLNFIRDAAEGEASSWNGNNIYTYVFAPIDKAYVKYEINFMPGDENFNNCKFATQGHAPISPNLYCTDAGSTVNHCLNRYQWNKIVYIFKNNSTTVDTSTYLVHGTYDMYVNGVQIADDVAVDLRKTSNSNSASNMPIRFAVYGTDTTIDNAVNYSAISCFMDDIDVRWYDEEPILPAMPYAIDDGGETVLIENGTYTIYEDKKVSDIKVCNGGKLTVFDSLTYDYYLINENALYNNNLIVVSDKYNQYTYYVVKKETRNNATITPYLGYYEATANLKDAVLLLAGYDESGAMKAINYSKGNGNVLVRINGDYAKVKAFVWNSMNQLISVASPKEYNANQIVACWGASITYGQGAANQDTDTYPAQLAAMTGFTVYNMGVGGETQTTIAARQGGLDIRLTSDVTIPASGSVNIEFAAYDKDGTYAGVVTPRNAALAGWNPVTINGIEGNLSVVVNNEVWPRVLKSATFTRTTPGEAVEAKTGDIMTVEAHKVNDAADITLICVSSNGGWSSDNLTASDSQHQDLIVLVDKMIAAAKDPDKYLVVGLTTGESDAWTNTHKALANKYGDKFLNIKDYITSEQALIDSGITATDTDKEWIAKGHVPPSLINNPGTDNVHLNSAGYAAMARDIYKRFVELGYYVEQ